jgi:hypothetical protein
MLYKNLIIRTFSSDHPHNNCILWKYADNKKLRIKQLEQNRCAMACQSFASILKIDKSSSK